MTRPAAPLPQKSEAPRSLPRRGALALSFLVAVLTIGGSEFLLRLIAVPPGFFPINLREDSLYVPDSIRGYALRPGARHMYTTPELSVLLAVNDDGLRGPTVAEAKAADYRVLAIGDSFTFGLAIRQEDSWGAQLQQLLAEADRGHSVAVVNSGVPGYSPRQIRRRFEQLLPSVNPSLVVFGLTMETFNRMQDPVALYGGTLVRSSVVPYLATTDHGLLFSPFASLRLRTVDYWLNQHFQLAAHLLSHADKLGQRLHLASGGPPSPVWPVDSLTALAEMRPTFLELGGVREALTARGIPFIVLFINAQRPDGRFDTPEMPQHLYNALMMEECRRQGIQAIDLLPELERQAAQKPIFRTEHDQHWTPAAHRIAAESLAVAIRTLRSRPAPAVR
jgi:acetyltransferase AlgX (SGNH hydrolase-like protein)